MEAHYDQILDSPSKNSYIGSYYQPPDRMLPTPRKLEFAAHPSTSMDPEMSSPQTKPNIDSRAVVDALKTLQQKIRRLELERKQAERSFRQYSHDVQKQQQVTASSSVPSQPAANLPESDNSGRKELDSKLQSTEARCKVLEKQLDYMRKMVENAKKERNAIMEDQASLQNQQPSSSSTQSQREKLEKLESECLKLSRTQTLAEMKLAILEQKLLKEEHERQLVQEKADQLQKELDINFRLSVSSSEEKPKKKTKKTTPVLLLLIKLINSVYLVDKNNICLHSSDNSCLLPQKTSRQNELTSPSVPKHKKMPFVAGTSTSPSHSVHANIQSILHMMKHHQPQLCERVSALQKSGCGAKKSLQKDFSPSSTTSRKPDREPEKSDQSLGSLSDLLLALQDELGQMSFEHQELVGQIDATQHREQRKDLQRELERLVTRMEEKGAQIMKLRKHQQTVHKLTKSQPDEHRAKKLSGIKPPAPSPVRSKQKGKKGATQPNNLQLLRETQKFRNSLKQDDVSWET